MAVPDSNNPAAVAPPIDVWKRLCPVLLAGLCSSAVAHGQEVGASVYARTDSAQTTVIAPRIRANLPLATDTSVELVYAVDVWTSASVDIVTAASRYPDGTIKPVTEQRDEVSGSITHELADITLTGGARYSSEPDYQARSISGGAGYDFAENNATVGVGLSAGFDDVGRAGDPGFARSLNTQGVNLSFTQVLGVATVAQVVYDTVRVDGYQSSPYRFVAIGGGQCTRSSLQAAGGPAAQGPGAPITAGLAPVCVSEHNPELRQRHAVGLQLRQSLGTAWSVGSGYRYYFDDWGIHSHTLRAELAWLAGERTLLATRYRFYGQGAADHYQTQYTTLPRYATRDKELSPLTSHRLAIEAEQTVVFDGSDVEFDMTLSAAPVFYSYSDFPGLQSITAFDANLTLVLRL